MGLSASYHAVPADAVADIRRAVLRAEDDEDGWDELWGHIDGGQSIELGKSYDSLSYVLSGVPPFSTVPPDTRTSSIIDGIGGVAGALGEGVQRKVTDVLREVVGEPPGPLEEMAVADLQARAWAVTGRHGLVVSDEQLWLNDVTDVSRIRPALVSVTEDEIRARFDREAMRQQHVRVWGSQDEDAIASLLEDAMKLRDFYRQAPGAVIVSID